MFSCVLVGIGSSTLPACSRRKGGGSESRPALRWHAQSVGHDFDRCSSQSACRCYAGFEEGVRGICTSKMMARQ
eukprot:5409396-Alexandrium_andersonii.AAC.1